MIPCLYITLSKLQMEVFLGLTLYFKEWLRRCISTLFFIVIPKLLICKWNYYKGKKKIRFQSLCSMISGNNMEMTFQCFFEIFLKDLLVSPCAPACTHSITFAHSWPYHFFYTYCRLLRYPMPLHSTSLFISINTSSLLTLTNFFQQSWVTYPCLLPFYKQIE